MLIPEAWQPAELKKTLALKKLLDVFGRSEFQGQCTGFVCIEIFGLARDDKPVEGRIPADFIVEEFGEVGRDASKQVGRAHVKGEHRRLRPSFVSGLSR